MEKYELLERVGSGNFSVVYMARGLKDNELLAVKVITSHHNIAMREAHLLKRLDHPNIVRLIDVYHAQQEVHLVLQYLPQNALELYEKQQRLTQDQVKCILFQTAFGLSYIHDRNIIHRDLKPENILIDKTVPLVKIIDFGLAIETHSVSTDYVATRWYRAPQNLLGTKEYSVAIDVFSLGCIIVQLLTGEPLFAGKDNIDQLVKIFSVIGSPTETSWPKGYTKFVEMGLKLQVGGGESKRRTLKQILSCASPGFTSLVEKMLVLDPKRRISCRQLLMDPYFNGVSQLLPPNINRRFTQQHLLLKKCGSLDSLTPVSSTIMTASPLHPSPSINTSISNQLPQSHQLSPNISITKTMVAPQISSHSPPSLCLNLTQSQIQMQPMTSAPISPTPHYISKRSTHDQLQRKVTHLDLSGDCLQKSQIASLRLKPNKIVNNDTLKSLQITDRKKKDQPVKKIKFYCKNVEQKIQKDTMKGSKRERTKQTVQQRDFMRETQRQREMLKEIQREREREAQRQLMKEMQRDMQRQTHKGTHRETYREGKDGYRQFHQKDTHNRGDTYIRGDTYKQSHNRDTYNRDNRDNRDTYKESHNRDTYREMQFSKELNQQQSLLNLKYSQLAMLESQRKKSGQAEEGRRHKYKPQDREFKERYTYEIKDKCTQESNRERYTQDSHRMKMEEGKKSPLNKERGQIKEKSPHHKSPHERGLQEIIEKRRKKDQQRYIEERGTALLGSGKKIVLSKDYYRSIDQETTSARLQRNKSQNRMDQLWVKHKQRKGENKLVASKSDHQVSNRTKAEVKEPLKLLRSIPDSREYVLTGRKAHFNSPQPQQIRKLEFRSPKNYNSTRMSPTLKQKLLFQKK